VVGGDGEKGKGRGEREGRKRGRGAWAGKGGDSFDSFALYTQSNSKLIRTGAKNQFAASAIIGGGEKRGIRKGEKEGEGKGKEKEREDKGRSPRERTYFASVKIKSWVRP